MSWARTLIALLLSISAVACSDSADDNIILPLTTGQATVAPSNQAIHFAVLNTGRARVTVAVPPPPQISTPVDILVLFDRTQSMEKYIRNSAEAAGALVEQVRSLAPDSRFAVATLADYPSHSPTEPASRPWHLEQDFTTDPVAIQGSMNAIRVSHGGDAPEAYTTALFESARLQWRTSTRRFVVLVGDSYSHPVDPGPDGIEETSDDLRFADAVIKLQEARLTILGIQAGADPRATAMFRLLASGTGGNLSPLDSATDSARLIQASVLSALLPTNELMPQGDHASWVESIVPDAADRLGTWSYALNVALPPDTPSGLYRIPVMVRLHEGDGTQSTVVMIRLIVGWINHPLTPFLPLLLLLALAVFLILRTVTSHTDSRYSVFGSGPFWVDTPAWIMALLEGLVWFAVILALTGIALLLNDDWIASDILRQWFAK
jgi:hypothetical protein